MSLRCQWRGMRERNSSYVQGRAPYRCEEEGTWEDPTIPGDLYCPKHAKIVQKQGS